MKKLILLLIICSPLTTFAALSDDLVSYWTMDEESGARYDSTATGNDLSDNNTVLYGTGKVGNSATFVGGNSEYLNDTTPTGLPTGTTARTINLWFKTPNPTGAKSIFFYGTASSDAMQSFYLSGTYLSYSGYGDDMEMTVSLSNNTWYMMTGTYDGSEACFYLDTVEVKCEAHSWNTVNSKLEIGVENTTNYFLTGDIDEMGIWGRVLESSEILELYNSGAGITYSDIQGEETGGGTAVATTTNDILALGSLNFALGIIIVLMMLGFTGYIFNRISSKKPWK